MFLSGAIQAIPIVFERYWYGTAGSVIYALRSQVVILRYSSQKFLWLPNFVLWKCASRNKFPVRTISDQTLLFHIFLSQCSHFISKALIWNQRICSKFYTKAAKFVNVFFINFQSFWEFFKPFPVDSTSLHSFIHSQTSGFLWFSSIFQSLHSVVSSSLHNKSLCSSVDQIIESKSNNLRWPRAYISKQFLSSHDKVVPISANFSN